MGQIKLKQTSVNYSANRSPKKGKLHSLRVHLITRASFEAHRSNLVDTGATKMNAKCE
jgi:hypothetical protein